MTNPYVLEKDALSSFESETIVEDEEVVDPDAHTVGLQGSSEFEVTSSGDFEISTHCLFDTKHHFENYHEIPRRLLFPKALGTIWLTYSEENELPAGDAYFLWRCRFERRRVHRKPLEEQFKELATRWRQETDGYSLAMKKAKHRDYRTIIAFGPPVVPYILKELREHGGHWFWALTEITGDNPIPMDVAGNVAKMRECWLEWGEQQGLI
ncbi:MAG: hypothetical protein K2X93_24075 [Candidatus Obscuribacterales bacterium]|nr:hypothetical protein [Candidatus Obscuribacterales bacterium]